MGRLTRLLVLIGFVFAMQGCASTRAPIPPGVVPDARDVSAEDEEYGQEVLGTLLDQSQLEHDDAVVNRVRDIVDRLAEAANGKDKNWHIYVLKDDNFKNAAATRGNYIFVWTGILSTVKDDDELATILAHEIGHLLAGHTDPDPNEEAAKIIAGIAGIAAGGVTSVQGGAGPLADLASNITASIINAALVNPAQQQDELEADHIGLFLMARAGINPEKAIDYWERVKNDPDFGGSSIQFLSSHPSSADRVEKLRALLPDALWQYRSPGVAKRLRGDASSSPARPPNKASPVTLADAPGEPWTVELDGIPIFEKDDPASTIIGALERGATVKVRKIEGRWLHLSAPIEGFAQSRNLRPLRE